MIARSVIARRGAARRAAASIGCWLVLLRSPVRAQAEGPASAAVDVDLDGDGDIDDADRALLSAAEVVTVESKSDGQRLRESARAVTVIETRRDRERTADLGEVLSRAQGIHVRRSGGLGSAIRLSLNGLYDEQIRLFLDGVPLAFAGWGSGLADVPIELVQRIDVHRGVVPIALGADALGGAIDLVTDPSWVDRAAASVQVGSFGTTRATAFARARDPDTGLALGLSLFATRAANDYPVDVKISDDTGQLRSARVRRFHDGYMAAGGSAELGVVERGALRRALLRLYTTRDHKELQHNLAMTVPYGEASYGESAAGATADVVVETGAWQARLLAGAAHRRIGFRDTAMWVYDWFGNRVRPRSQPGEVGTSPTDRLVTEDALFARITAERALGDHQRLRATIAPTGALRGGRDFLDPNPGGRDPLSARRDLFELVTGVEHESRTAGARIENFAFVKHYAMWTSAEDVQPGFVFVPATQRTQRIGLGDGLRWRVGDGLALKASYEWATRLPSVDELFGNGVLIDPDLDLVPETSHNANLSARIDRGGRLGAWSSDVDVFLRDTDHLIVLLPADQRFSYQNVQQVRVIGVEGSAGWVAPGGWASIDASATVEDMRNVSSEGRFAAYHGDRVPNRPWLFGSLGATLRTRDLLRSGDELSVFASSRYVHDFLRGWASLGREESKQVISSQLVHGAGVTYALRGAQALTTTVEIQNLTDARAFDSYGASRPGRGVFVKLGGEL